MLYLHHHLGLGDHIICNGLVRSLVSTKGNVTLFVKNNNLPRVQRMYDDEPRIHLVSVPTGVDEYSFVDAHVYSNGGKLLRVGFDQLQKSPSMNFDQVFYIYAGVPYSHRWDRFFIRRDPNEEERVLRKLNPTGEPYVFVHDDPSRGFSFTPLNPNGFRVIRNDVSEDIFSMIGVLENASEIHCMESSFRCLIEHLPNVNCPLFLHTNVRTDWHGETIVSGNRKNWTIV